MAITIELSAEEEARLRELASANGQEVGEYLKDVALNAHTRPTRPHAYGPADGNTDPNGAVYDASAALDLLRRMAETDEFGTEAEQRETFEFLKKAIDEDRPGQQSIFGTGINPYPNDAPADDQKPRGGE